MAAPPLFCARTIATDDSGPQARFRLRVSSIALRPDISLVVQQGGSLGRDGLNWRTRLNLRRGRRKVSRFCGAGRGFGWTGGKTRC